jgi:hypothetical protein
MDAAAAYIAEETTYEIPYAPLLQRRENGCMWPVGHDRPQLYCNKNRKDRIASYCEYHDKLAYVPRVHSPKKRAYR